MANEQNLKPFVKGDPRINRGGRPKTFDAWRTLTVEVLREPAKDKYGKFIVIVDEISETEKDEKGKPLIVKSHIATNAEMIARKWMENPKRQQSLIEAAYGKVPIVIEQQEKIVDTRPVSVPAELIAPDFFASHRAIESGNYSEIFEYGGRGSTKSSFVSVEFIKQLVNDPTAHGLVMRQVADTLRNSVYGQLQWAIDMLGLTEKFKCAISPLEITYIPTNQKIYFRGADDPMKIKSIKPVFGAIKLLWFEEVPEFHGEAAIRSIIQSAIRGTETALTFWTWNPPPTTGNWINKHILVERPGRWIHKSDYRSVPADWLGKAFIDFAEFLKEVNPKAYEHEYLGIVNGLGDMIFENLEIREITDEELKVFDNIDNGLDFGYYPHPAHFAKTYYNASKHILYIIEEVRKWKASNREMYDAIVEEGGYKYDDLLIADSEDPKSIADYRDYGARVIGAEKGPGSVKYSIKWLQSLVKIVICKKRCPYTVEEFTDYAYEKTKDGEIIEAYPREKDDAIAAVRYSQNLQWRRPGE